MDKEEQARAEKSAESRRIADEKAKKKAEQDLRDNAIVSLRPVDSDNKQKAVQKDQKPQAAAQPAAQSTKDKQSAEQKKIEADQKQKLAHTEVAKAVNKPVVNAKPVVAAKPIADVKPVVAAKPVAVAAKQALVAKPVTMSVV